MFENLSFFFGLGPSIWIVLLFTFFLLGFAYSWASSRRYAFVLQEAREERVVLLAERKEASRQQQSEEAVQAAPAGPANQWSEFGKPTG